MDQIGDEGNGSHVPGRTLVVQRAENLHRNDISPRASALFVTQLIANAQQLPQCRARRRAEPEVARTIYAEGLAKGRRRRPHLSVEA